MSTIPLPALAVQPPAQQPGPLEQFGQLQRLHTLLGQQQLQQQQIQAGQQENQIRQQQLKDQQATTQALKDWDGQNYQSLTKKVIDAGGSGNAALAIQQHGLTVKKTVSDIAAQDAKTGESNLQTFIGKHKAIGDALEGIENVPDKDLHGAAVNIINELSSGGVFDQIGKPGSGAPVAQQMLQKVISIQDPKALRDQIDMLAKASMGAKAAAEQQQAEATLAHTQGEEQRAQQLFPSQLASSQAGAKIAAVTAQNAPAQQAATLASTRATTAKSIAETEKTRAETANLGDQPIFAVDPATNERVMTTRPEAKAKGYTNPVAVKEGDVSKETDARAMINDVQLNKSRYQVAMQRVYSEPMTNAQKTALVALTPEKLGVDFGSLFKLELPDVMQKVSNASAFSVLSPAQKQAVIGYYSTLASVPAAQKALTNIGRSNKEMMDLELRTIPTPLMDGGTFNAMLDRFQGNIEQTARKTVRMPGMPSTDDIRSLYEGGQRQQRQPAVNFNMPRPFQAQQGLVPLSTLLGVTQ